ncbi:MAG: MFS transporter [Coriobacteriia bacterium]|nr:MFS transporter [Coriobacteriia bacterium]
MTDEPRKDIDIDLETCGADACAPTPNVVKLGTFGSLRYHDFRLFLTGTLLSNIGSWMQSYALGIVVFSFRQSEFDLGLVGFLSGIPILLLSLPAGVLADRVDSRRMLIWMQAVLLGQAATLGVLYKTGVVSSSNPLASLLWVASLGLFGGIFVAFQGPAFQSMLPNLIPRRFLMNGIALNSAQLQSSRLFGPLIAAGLVLAGAGMAGVFFANAVSFLFVIAALSAIRPCLEAEARSTGLKRTHEQAWQALTAGIRYAKADGAVGVLLISTALVTLCGFPYITLLPAIVSETLNASVVAYPRWTAFIMAANGFGALVGALVVASLPASLRRARIIPIAVLSFGVVLICFALSRSIWLSIPLSALGGIALMAINSMTNTSIQAAVPGKLRGRVMALFVMAFMGIMPVSSIVSGSLGQLAGPSTAVLTGALLLLLWGLTLLTHPQWFVHHAG